MSLYSNRIYLEPNPGGVFTVWYNPENDHTVAIPDWGSRDLAAGTVRAIIGELGIGRQQFGPIE